MRRRLVATMVGLLSMAVLLLGIPLALIVSRSIDDQAVLALERRAVLAASTVESPQWPSTVSGSEDVRFGWYDTRGELHAGYGPAHADALTLRGLDNVVVDGELNETLVVVVPVVSNGAPAGVVRAEQATTSIDRRVERILALLALPAVVAIGLAALLGYVIAGRITRPIRAIRDATVRLGEGDFTITTPTSNIAELADTAGALAATARRLDDLVARERAFSADVSHQLRTPLTAMRATVEGELAFPRSDRREALQETLGDIDRLEATIGELLTIARTVTPSGTFDLGPVLVEMEATWRPRFAAADRRLSVGQVRYQPSVLGQPAMLRHTLDILLDNALTHGAGTATVSISHTTDIVTLSVADEGPGFADGETSSSRSSRSDGHGHGLALAHRLVAAMHGRLTPAHTTAGPRIDVILRRAASPEVQTSG
jgi:signal transduction histidine kinase